MRTKTGSSTFSPESFRTRATELTQLVGLAKGVHNDWVYKRLEDAHDDVADLQIEESEGHISNLLRIRIMRDLAFDSKWHELVADEKLELTLRE